MHWIFFLGSKMLQGESIWNLLFFQAKHRHKLRDRRTNTTACQVAVRWGQMKWNSVWWGKSFFTGLTWAAKQDKNLLYRHDMPNEPTKEGPLSLVLYESPFTPVSTVRKGHPFLVSLRPRLVFLVCTREYFLPWLVQSVRYKRIFSWLGWSSRSCTSEYFPALAGLVGPVQENIFLTWLIFLVCTSEYFPALAGLIGPVQENIFLPWLI
jgi:hypothetical protein